MPGTGNEKVSADGELGGELLRKGLEGLQQRGGFFGRARLHWHIIVHP